MSIVGCLIRRASVDKFQLLCIPVIGYPFCFFGGSYSSLVAKSIGCHYIFSISWFFYISLIELSVDFILANDSLSSDTKLSMGFNGLFMWRKKGDGVHIDDLGNKIFSFLDLFYVRPCRTRIYFI
ncbi:hypothetical protein AMTRI_Chr04g244150 [Amborella trichopoda]